MITAKQMLAIADRLALTLERDAGGFLTYEEYKELVLTKLQSPESIEVDLPHNTKEGDLVVAMTEFIPESESTPFPESSEAEDDIELTLDELLRGLLSLHSEAMDLIETIRNRVDNLESTQDQAEHEQEP